MDKLNMKSVDITQMNIEKIARIFPNVITEIKDENGRLKKAVDFELLRQEMSGELIEGEKERYRLTWPGKKDAIVSANMPSVKTLRPVKDDSICWEETQNLYIEGDNLEVLKLLQVAYLNKIKCIYIDPPYNTGNDFIYRDDFRQSTGTYLAESGQIDGMGNRLFQNSETNGRFHSDWLSMMYSRIKLSRSLLKKDGIIFISMDDNEVSNLRKICDEIFGEDNFVGQVVRVAKTTSFRGNFFAPGKDYILCYARSINDLSRFTDDVDEGQFNKIEQGGPRKGERYRDDIAFYLSTLETRPNQRYFIKCPDGSSVIPPGETMPPERPKEGDGVWRWNLDTFEHKKEYMVFKRTNRSPLVDENGNQANWNVYTKSYLKDKLESGNIPRDFFEGFLNRNGTEDLKKLDIPFDFPKPVELVHYLLKIIGTKGDDIILDFFSGSATTAHAVMKLNSEDGGTRRFIMIQLPEPVPPDTEAHKAGYRYISELGKERIRRAAMKLKEDTGADIDYGFRVYRVDSSNMKDIYYSPEKLEQQDLLELESNVKDDRTGEDLLIQVMLECGLQLSLHMETQDIQGRKVHFIAGNSLAACFEKEVPEAVIREIAAGQPLRAVFVDSSFKNDAARINAEELFKMLSPSTEIKVI